MCPRKRTTDKHLPERVYQKHSAFYFVDKNNKWHRLGKTLPEAMAEWAKLVEQSQNPTTMNDVFDRYMTEIAPQKATRTYQDNIHQMNKLRSVFSEMHPADIKPIHIYQYLDKRGQKATRRANMEKALLSHVFSMAIRWGIVTDNPCRNVKKLTEEKRDRYITDDEFIAVRELASPLLRYFMDLAYITGLRRGDILKIKLSDLNDEGIQVNVNKTNKKVLIEWSDELKQIYKNIRMLPRPISGLYLFCNKRGQPYTTDGFNSMWQNLIKKALSMDVIKERFRFHDIRRKTATDAERIQGREFARKLLGHSTQNMTKQYISGLQKIRPLK